MVKNQAEEIRSYLLAKIPVHPKNIVAKAAEAFSCSRTTVHRHLNRLLRDGKIIKSGGKELALELEEKGYDWLIDPVVSS